MTGHILTSKPKRVTKTFAAKKLQVTREHLSRVLHGQRESRRLIHQYANFMNTRGLPLPDLPALKKFQPPKEISDQ